MDLKFFKIVSLVCPLGLAIFAASSCQDSSAPREGKPASSSSPLVHATNYPLFYFASRIAGNLADINFEAPPDGDPAFWKPDDDAISSMQKAGAILMNGAGYEKWAASASLPLNTQIDSSRGFHDSLITEEGGVTHRHGDGSEHSHAGIAFTTWLDMAQAKKQAEAVRDALVKLAPNSKETMEKNADSLFADLDKLDGQLKEIGGSLRGVPLLASHPVYQYLARAYGLSIRSLHWEPETVPDDSAMKDLEKITVDHSAAVMIWEGPPAVESVAKLKEKGIKSIVFDPCGNRPDQGDWLSIMKENVQSLGSLTDG